MIVKHNNNYQKNMMNSQETIIKISPHLFRRENPNNNETNEHGNTTETCWRRKQ
jgi:hypothetical protein